MKPKIGEKYLIVTNNCLYRRESIEHDAIYGEVLNIIDVNESLWFVMIGNNEDFALISHTQIKNAIKTDGSLSCSNGITDKYGCDKVYVF